MTKVYYNSDLTLAVGAQDVVADLTFDAVEGSVYIIREADLIMASNGDTANAYHAFWLSVLRDGRATWDPFSEGFEADIIGHLVNVKATRGFGAFPMENPNEGYLADDPYFEDTIRFGLSSPANVAGANVTASLRLAVERVRATQDIRQLMYTRSFT